jgi:hypothetical protein
MRFSARRVVCVAFCLAGFVSFVSATTYPVINTNDSGAGSLRQAIMDANGNPGADVITFAIPGAGVQTIAIAAGSPLPPITDSVTINGYSQPGAVANTNGPGLGLNGTLLIELNGAAGVATGLTIAANDVTIRGLVINRFTTNDIVIPDDASNWSNVKIEGNYLGSNASGTANFSGKDFWGIVVGGGTNDTIGGTTPLSRNLINSGFRGIEVGDHANTGLTIQGNLIGTNAAGTASLGPQTGYSVSLRVISNSTVGGLTPAAANVISGAGTGIGLGNSIGGTSVVNVAVQGNFIGTDVTGTKIVGNSGHGIAIASINGFIGGTAAGAGNVISGNTGDGVNIQGNGAVIQGNFIGTDHTGLIDLGNGGMGVNVLANDSVVGGTAAGAGNVIAFNGGTGPSAGVGVSGQRVRVRGNSIHGTKDHGAGGLGIDLVADSALGVTPNDAGDLDPDTVHGHTGGNSLQNFPIMTASSFSAAGATVSMTLNSAPSTTYDVDVYANPACAPRPQEFVEGQTYLGSLQMNTDGSGNASVNNAFFPVAGGVPAGSRVTATATDPAGDTSEFSQRNVFSVSPISEPAAGGASITLSGMLFQAPATVTVNGVAATNVNVSNVNTITATAPPVGAGSVNSIVVTSGGLTGTLPSAFVGDFNDVPSGNGFNSFVDKLIINSITAGCGNGNYCASSPVTRAQMAVFLLRGHNGLCYVPPPATGTVFGDVTGGGFAAWIEALAAAQVTSGCGNGNYCPNDPVTRAQMAVFLLRTAFGPAYNPPACTTATFADVPCSSGFSKWIYDLVSRSITAGCGGGNYCPNDSVTRAQMAVFLVTTFGLS